MIRPVAFLCVAASLVAGCAAGPQRATSGEPAREGVEARIARVERGLLPPIQVEGASTWPLEERMRRWRVPGVSVAVIDHGAIEWARGYGSLEAGAANPVTAASLFLAGSISKPVAALGALKLVDSNALGLDDDVNAWLRSWRVPANEMTARSPVTLRGLLSHGAGVTVHGFPGYPRNGAIPTLTQILDGVSPANTPPIRVDQVPGSAWRYSGGGYTILQQLVIDLTGRSFPAAMEELVLGPAGMTSSTFEQPLPEPLDASAARGHKGGRVVPGGWHVYPEMAAAGLWTTPTDLARLVQAIQERLAGGESAVITARNAEEMLRVQSGTWGLGFELAGSGRSLRFQHGGIDEGYDALLVAYSSTGQGAIVMANGNSGNQLPQEIVRAIAAEYAWPDYLPAARKTVEVGVETLDRYVGEYRSDVGIPIRFSREGNRFFLQGQGQSRVEAFAAAPNRFFPREVEAEAEFEIGPDGEVTGMVWRQRAVIHYRRVPATP